MLCLINRKKQLLSYRSRLTKSTIKIQVLAEMQNCLLVSAFTIYYARSNQPYIYYQPQRDWLINQLGECCFLNCVLLLSSFCGSLVYYCFIIKGSQVSCRKCIGFCPSSALVLLQCRIHTDPQDGLPFPPKCLP